MTGLKSKLGVKRIDGTSTEVSGPNAVREGAGAVSSEAGPAFLVGPVHEVWGYGETLSLLAEDLPGLHVSPIRKHAAPRACLPWENVRHLSLHLPVGFHPHPRVRLLVGDRHRQRETHRESKRELETTVASLRPPDRVSSLQPSHMPTPTRAAKNTNGLPRLCLIPFAYLVLKPH